MVKVFKLSIWLFSRKLNVFQKVFLWQTIACLKRSKKNILVFETQDRTPPSEILHIKMGKKTQKFFSLSLKKVFFSFFFCHWSLHDTSLWKGYWLHFLFFTITTRVFFVKVSSGRLVKKIFFSSITSCKYPGIILRLFLKRRIRRETFAFWKKKKH